MEDLFPNLWVSSNGMPELTNGKFETWCRKLADLSLDNFGKAFAGLETAIELGTQKGKKVFPPSYAEFRGYSKGPAHDAITAQQARQADTRPLMITRQPTEAEREFGNQQSAALKGLFG